MNCAPARFEREHEIGIDPYARFHVLPGKNLVAAGFDALELEFAGGVGIRHSVEIVAPAARCIGNQHDNRGRCRVALRVQNSSLQRSRIGAEHRVNRT